jgi:hypothetical protein
MDCDWNCEIRQSVFECGDDDGTAQRCLIVTSGQG